jgi:hypothetical protein
MEPTNKKLNSCFKKHCKLHAELHDLQLKMRDRLQKTKTAFNIKHMEKTQVKIDDCNAKIKKNLEHYLQTEQDMNACLERHVNSIKRSVYEDMLPKFIDKIKTQFPLVLDNGYTINIQNGRLPQNENLSFV